MGQMVKRKKDWGLWKLSGGLEMPRQVGDGVGPPSSFMCLNQEERYTSLEG